jgi:protein-L-isoaspartate(D-aspartate) O-methyltransferase
VERIAFRKLRDEMVKNDLSPYIKDERVLRAFREVPREKFIDPLLQSKAYINQPLPIAYGQMISQPYVVALMCEILHTEKEDKILDIGTGSGYQAAILSRLCKEVISIERIPQLAVNAKNILKKLRYKNIQIVTGDGCDGYAKEAPYDKIISAAATRDIPSEWLKQLKDGGILVYPKYINGTQVLVSVRKSHRSFIHDYHDYVYFVPLIKG